MHKFVRRFLKAGLGLAILSCGDASHPTGPGDSSSGVKVSTDAVTSEGTGGPTIATDKADYAPGDTVQIIGAGWQPNEVISLHLEEDPANNPPTDWNVVADSIGSFADRTFAVTESHLGVAFTLMATGAFAADTAQGTFTDGNISIRTNFGAAVVHWKYYDTNATCTSPFFSQVTNLGISTIATPLAAVSTSQSISLDLTSIPTGTTFVGWATPGGTPTSSTNDPECFIGTGPARTWIANFAINTTTGIVADSVSPETAGVPITFTASVSKNTDASAATGKVKFYDGGDCTTLGTQFGPGGGTSLSSGAASVTTSSLSVGAHTIVACYQGDNGTPDLLASGSSMSFTITAASVATSTSVGASPASPSEFGTSVTFTASVTQTVGGAAVTTGNISFHDTSCAGALLQAAAAVDGSGQKTYTTSSLSVGGHTVAACYEGATGFDASNGTAPYTINKIATATVVTSDLTSPQPVGTSVTFTATVTRTTGGAAVALGNVRFIEGGSCASPTTVLQSATAVNGSGQVTYTTSALAVGSHTIVGCYDGDTNYDISNGSKAFNIDAASTLTSVSASPTSPREYGTSVTFTAAITSGGNPVLAGNVRFIEGGTCDSPTTTLQSATAVNGSGEVAYTTSVLSVATHTIRACYDGVTNYAASTGTTSYTIDKIATGTAVTSDVTTPQPVGTSVTFTATVTRTTGGAAVALGNVRFIEGGSCASPTTVLQSATAVNGSGQVTYTTSALAVGSHTIVGCYDGDTNYAISSGSKVFTIDAATTLTSVSASPTSPREYGTSVTFTAAVTSGGNPVLSGNVRFIESGTCDSPGTTLQSATAVNGSGEVAYTTSSLSVAAHTIRACFDGTTNYAASTGTNSYTINKIGTTTDLTSDVASPQESGAAIVFTAEVNRSTGGANVTQGDVAFYDGGSCSSPGALLQAAASVDGTGKKTLSTSALSIGSHTIVACYLGNDTLATSDDSESYSITKVLTTTTLTPSVASPQEYGTSVTFTAEVNRTNGGSDVLAGNVAFYEGGTCAAPGTSIQSATAVDVAGKVTYTPSPFAVGVHSIVACYEGTATYDTSGDTEPYTVTKILTTTAVSVLPSSPREYGTSVTFTAKVTRTNGGADVTTGDVAFYEGTDCSTGTQIQAASGVSGTGTVAFTSSNLTVGAHSILACYQENATYDDSNDAEPFTINKIATSTALTSDLTSPQTWGTSIVFTAEVNRVSNSSDIRDGNVGFYDGGSCAAPGTELQAPGALDSNGKKTFTTTSLTVGAHTIYACFIANDTLAASGASEAFTINKIPTTVTLNLTPSSSQQYSDSVALNASISPNTVAGSVQFQKSVDGGGYTNIGSPVAVASGAAGMKYNLLENSGNTLSFKAVFTPTDTDHYAGDDDSKGLTVTKEDARVGFDSNNPAALQVSAPGGTLNAGLLSLVITVREKTPDATAPGTAPGNIDLAGLSVSLNPIGGGSSTPLSCVKAYTSGTGYSPYQTYTCSNSGALVVNTYQVDASVPSTNLYYTGGDTDAFTVYDPSLGFATGGGTFNLNGDRVNFGFTMKYNKSGANLQGNLIAVRHHPDGTVSRIKSNSLGGLALGDLNGCGIAQFSGKATYSTWSSSINDYVNTGNNTFYVYAQDCNNPGNGYDYIWIDGPGNLDMPGNGETGKQLLTGGNIAVPHKPPR